MTTTLEPQQGGEVDESAESCPPVLDIVVPVYNEEAGLETAVERLRDHLSTHVPYDSRVTIADNASTDETLAIARRLASQYDDVRVVQLSKKGRGGALNRVWRTSDAEIVAYCDVDLSTDLNALMPLIAPLVSGHSDIAIGTRLSRSSRVVRGPKREMISRCYNLMLRTTMRAHFSDAQCGFKAMRTDVARRILPYVEDTGWFFDTELLVLAERIGLRIAEVPVDWTDDPDSSVDIVATAVADLCGCARVAWAFARGTLPIAELRATLGRDCRPGPPVDGVPHGMVGQVVRFCAVGVASTVAYAVLYLLLHSILGAQAANFVALALTAIANTAVNRRFTFGVRGSERALRDQLVGLCVFGFGWAVTAVALVCLHNFAPDAGRVAELVVLVVANLVATATRFVGLRTLFSTRAGSSEGESE
ncbi:bifunctional glycosyltransferase family 2/GtrA family protein [Gordonia sp. HY442]|uniref:bifunctional glycosyltransferase family 2/GtrA family protein n=1 Tax=Gordonia zhenghanii TaxID=2911516 RepID=UPI001F220DD5|nr:bifunctional glycosyltransferase family 2/GtrA family protein [Gordonia zhenghanii]MCF8607597.1 bifunctional glycosyltransferase family 2/GtrA family protein [Gordonia zhenghanii]